MLTLPIRPLLFAAASVVALSTGTITTASAYEPGACAAPQAEAAMINAVPPDYPAFSEQLGDTGTTVVQIDLLADGKLQKASVLRSSGNPMLDRAALDAAKMAEFRAERRDCAPVAGSYAYVVSFESR